LGFPGYSASATGLIRDNATGYLIKAFKNNGRKRVNINIPGSRCKKYVHTLVALAFKMRPPGVRTVLHIDGDVTNNNESNIVWKGINANAAWFEDGRVWKQVHGFPDYSASSEGLIRNNRTGRQVKTYGDTYKTVNIRLGAQRSHQYVHRLVALAFRGPPKNENLTVDHSDRDTSNNHESNLTWATRSEQTTNASRTRRWRRQIIRHCIETGVDTVHDGMEDAVRDVESDSFTLSAAARKASRNRNTELWGYTVDYMQPPSEWLWKPIPTSTIRGNTGYYASDTGYIKYPNGKFTNGSTQQYRRLHINGYDYKVHALVAAAWLPVDKERAYINHIDHDKLNNHYTNLERCTIRENSMAAVLHERIRALPVIQRSIEGCEIRKFVSASDAARSVERHVSNILRCCRGESTLSNGFKWTFQNLHTQES
jgi:HNH endonuclease